MKMIFYNSFKQLPRSPSQGILVIVSALYLFSGCGANPAIPKTSSNQTPQDLTDQSILASTYMATRFTFQYSDYYSLTAPNPATSCAGDAKTFYDILAPSSSYSTSSGKNLADPINWTKLPTNLIDTSTTLRPSFIKNVSVDVTNANAAVPNNLAQSCSYGSSITAPPISACATFDSGAMDGMPSPFGGAMVIIGGLTSPNYSFMPNAPSSVGVPYHGASFSCGPAYNTALLTPPNGVNRCDPNYYTISVNNIPATAAGPNSSLAPGQPTIPAEPISSWGTLDTSISASGPQGSIGAASTYNGDLKKFLVFAGSSPIATTSFGVSSVVSPTGNGTLTYDTWIFDLATQSWSKSNPNTAIDSFLLGTLDIDTSNTKRTLLKQTGSRAIFGYTPMHGAAISRLSLNGAVKSTNGAGVDSTDRIIIVGGMGQCSSGSYCNDVHSINPTYGPDYYDVEDASNPIASVPYSTDPTQWIDSYYSHSWNNSDLNSVYSPIRSANGFPQPSPLPSPSAIPIAINFGMVSLNNNNSLSTGVGPHSALPAYKAAGTGYLLVAGGFYSYPSPSGRTNIPASSGQCNTINACGALQMALRWFASPWSSPSEAFTANFGVASNYANPPPSGISTGNQATPLKWAAAIEGASPLTTPWFGGNAMVNGFSLLNNDVVYFGGADCRDYLLDPTTSCPNWNPIMGTGNPGRYWRFGIDPAQTIQSPPYYPSVISMSGIVPKNAGMAVARGVDAQNSPLIVAWSGMRGPTSIDNNTTDTTLLLNAGTAASPNPTWTKVPSAISPPPLGLANAAMAFSHITGKFYLFGGYNPQTGTSGDTWELSIDPSTASCATPSDPKFTKCQFVWKLLNAASGLTCFPYCPPARRSHKMIEVDYNYFNAPNEPDCTHSNTPCSLAIFMEGGTPDGVSQPFTDRWIFDPTANGGGGHWQLMNELPPRIFPALASVNYSIPNTPNVAHRAIMFGGETGLQGAPQAKGVTGTGYFVTPTLGDTWMYDYDTNSWNRVRLYGERFDPNTSYTFTTETEARASSFVSDLTTQEFTPPPLTGAIMITRPASKKTHTAQEAPQALAIPQIFLFGGRLKDGTFNQISNTYKFCAGTTGEKPFPMSLKGTAVPGPDDASCDSFDPVTNPQSLSPTYSYVGRWLVKHPVGLGGFDPSGYGAYLGAGTYDSLHDKILFFGGIAPSNSGFITTAITDQTHTSANINVYEYTPPSAVNYGINSPEFNGAWAKIPACQDSPSIPTGRYGHSMAYDPLNKIIIVVGGLDPSGNPLVQTQTYFDGRTYTIPEVWTAYRIDNISPNGFPDNNIPPVLQGPFPCYYWSPITVFGNAYQDYSQNLLRNGFAFASTLYIPPTGYNSGYYTMNDAACVAAGPISSSDPSINKLLVGGAYIDIDRSQLGASENLILNLTYIPLGTKNTDATNAFLKEDQTAIFKVHLVRTGETGDIIRQRPQPRDLTYAATDQYPQIAPDIALIAPPNGQIRQEQVYIPLSLDSGIDRIRIERYSGSAILIDASVYRLGPPSTYQ